MIDFLRHAARVLQTVRYLRPRQMLYQLRARVPRRVVLEASRDVDLDCNLSLEPFIERRQSYLGSGRFRFLNRTADLGEEIDWAAKDLPLLWQYNLHYFDYLQQQSVDCETGGRLIEQWIDANPPSARTVAWQPYPTSLRIVNWLKFLSRTGEASPAFVQSLALQTENLRRRIEYHLLGNHLFANAKALWFAGLFLGLEDWRSLGRTIVLEQLREQFLPDGGHFELSPMYHAIALEDLLDLINLAHAVRDTGAQTQLKEVAGKALGWLAGMISTDGALPLLNDSANGVASPFATLTQYAARLNVAARDATTRSFENQWSGRNYSGYSVFTNGVFRLLFDTARLGPDYLPGHAHCDMLSVLLHVNSEPVLTDTGVFEYAESPRRTYSRSTAAHNTVQLDALEQGDIWKSFRMSKRGRPVSLNVTDHGIACEHTGYSIWCGGLSHRRTIRLLPRGFELVDDLTGPAEHQFASRLHFAPRTTVAIERTDRIRVGSDLVLSVTGGVPILSESEYFPEFGLIECRPCLVIAGVFKRSHQLRLTCTFSS